MRSASLSSPTALAPIKLLLGIAVLLILPHIGTLNPIFIGISLFFLAWRLIALFKPRLLPNNWLLLPLSFGMGFLVLKLHGMSLGREASSCFLLMLLGLKLLECKQNRDVLAAVFVSFFVLITPFLFEQTIPLAFYNLFIFLLLFSVLIINNAGSQSLSRVYFYRFAANITLLAIPLMLISFLLFPRVIGPLWALPSDANKGVSGISDTVNPGQFSNLALSNETAFRVRFADKAPAHQDLYWRGPVYWNTDGQKWARAAANPSLKVSQAAPSENKFSHSITMEPHERTWLFALDTPTTASESVRITNDYQLLMTNKLDRARSFDFTSSPRLAKTSLSEHERKRGLALPNSTDSRIYQLTMQWQQESNSPFEVVRKALGHFNKKFFYYTLSPPTLGKDPVAEFLFTTKRGFCGHYATSFAVLMRAAGIPARLVGGYQGGVYNAVGDFWEVRQADAHIWVEVWLEGRGWIRVDPTAAIAPSRIERSIDPNQLISGNEVSFLVLPTNTWRKFALQAESVLNAIDYYWQSGVLAYGPETQDDFLAHVGIDGWEDMILWLAVLSAITLAALTAYFHLSHYTQLDSAQRVYLAFCKKLAKKTGPRLSSESASDYFKRATKHYPTQASVLNTIKRLYLKTRYAEIEGGALLKAIKRFNFVRG
ncbi:MAG: transglutaminase [Cycloclasticus sp. symbiont of Poecilosclerida sp. M]|nr:MAG: transglutaminase [Cycloclasticus sp. symbiont of Poecilosclerida sp. M]